MASSKKERNEGWKANCHFWGRSAGTFWQRLRVASGLVKQVRCCNPGQRGQLFHRRKSIGLKFISKVVRRVRRAQFYQLHDEAGTKLIGQWLFRVSNSDDTQLSRCWISLIHLLSTKCHLQTVGSECLASQLLLVCAGIDEVLSALKLDLLLSLHCLPHLALLELSASSRILIHH